MKSLVFYIISIGILVSFSSCGSSYKMREYFQDKGFFLGKVIERKTDGITISGLKVSVLDELDQIENLDYIDPRFFEVRYDIKDKKWYFAYTEPPLFELHGKPVIVGKVYRFYYYDMGFFPFGKEIIKILSAS